MKALIWTGEELGAEWDEVDIPAELADQAAEWHQTLVEELAQHDDVLLEKYLDEQEISEDELRTTLRTATIAGAVVPVLNGTAFKNKGVQPLLDAVVEYLPSPLDIPPTAGMNLKGNEQLERKASDDEPFSALAFKIMSDPHVGRLTYFRVYSGTLEKGGTVLNSRTQKKERIGRLLEMHANSREDREFVMAGDIVAGIGFKDTRTGDTLCDPGNPIVLEALEFPEPVIHVAVEPKTKADQDKMAKALHTLSEEDPTFQVRTDEETAETVISGMGELHLEVLVDRMLREFKVDATVGKPQVAYRETITQTVEKITYTHKKQTGGSGQYAEVTINMETTGPGGGYEFVDKISGGKIPKEYIPAVDAGLQSAMTTGVLAGLPHRRHPGHPRRRQVPRRRLLGDGVQDRRHHGVPEAVRKAKPALLEPIMNVEVVTPEDYMGDVIGDLNSRRGKVGQMEQRGNSQVINAQVPLSEMFGYATDLRSRTQGRATYTMQFDSYQQMPQGGPRRDRHPGARRVTTAHPPSRADT